MAIEDFDWKSALADLFGGTVNQQTLEEAAELMVSVSAVDVSYHVECLAMLDGGICAAREGDCSVIGCINKSGYQVSTTEEAESLLIDFRAIYVAEYGKTEKMGSDTVL